MQSISGGFISKGQVLFRDVFEELFDEEYPTKRPRSLKGLELDGYNQKRGLAFEYNGKQHYDFVPYFHNYDYNNFIKQKERDKEKRILCKKNGITLIDIPYYVSDIEAHIINELIKHGYNIYVSDDYIREDLNRHTVKQLKLIAKNVGVSKIRGLKHEIIEDICERILSLK